LKKDTQITVKPTQYGLGELYDKYGGMLLGYIYDIVNDNKLAEQYLISIYGSLSNNYNDLLNNGENVWCSLQRLAKNYISRNHQPAVADPLIKGINLSDRNNRNKFLKLMTHEQKEVFCGIYHYGKSICQLAKELNTSEDFIRKTLKETFAIIKKAS
jgi:hypothetical protein